jgi:3-dehydroquinate dehydratase/shikimate dehydrogenase
MFVHQGARQFEIWTGKPAPVADMQHVVVNELQTRAAAAKQAAIAAPAKKSHSAKK